MIGAGSISAGISVTRPDRRTGRRRSLARLRRRSAARSICSTCSTRSREPGVTSPGSRSDTTTCFHPAWCSASRPTLRSRARSAAAGALSSASIGLASYSEQMEFSGTLRGRIGYAPGNWLVYATGGLAWSFDQFTRTQLAGVPAGGTAPPGTSETVLMQPRAGWTLGAGVEFALLSHWTARVEYLFTDYGTRERPVPGRRAADSISDTRARRRPPRPELPARRRRLRNRPTPWRGPAPARDR